jgi:NNP family nitrate/nitrite transporter-like MFS transporter
MTFAIASFEPQTLQIASGTLIGKIPSGTQTYLQNSGYLWIIILIPVVISSWIGMNNIIDDHVSPNIGSLSSAIFKIIVMLTIGLITASFGLWLLLPKVANGSGWLINKWVVLPIVIALTVGCLKLLPLGSDYKKNISRQYQIFENKHTWAMTIIYTMTFGSFIGYSAALALSIKVIFGFQHLVIDGVMTHNMVNPNAPSALSYAWMGAFVGALIRPIGGTIADKIGGAKVTQIISAIMVASSLGVAYLFVVLFAATGVGNGSTFRTISQVFNKEQRGPVLGWTSAVAAYGAFIIPKVFGEQIKATTPENALYGFATFYLICMVINWWFYLRKKAEFQNP